MGRESSTTETDGEIHIKFGSDNFKGRNLTQDVGVNGKIILKRILRYAGCVSANCVQLALGSNQGRQF